MGDQEAVERPFGRRPGAHPGRGARPFEIDRGAAAEVVPAPVRGQLLLVAAPAELSRLAALADEAVDRPGVDELADLLRTGGDLGVALGDVAYIRSEEHKSELQSLMSRSYAVF